MSQITKISIIDIFNKHHSLNCLCLTSDLLLESIDYIRCILSPLGLIPIEIRINNLKLSDDFVAELLETSALEKPARYMN